MEINYQELIDNLEDDKIILLMEQLGCDNYADKGDYIIFPTICHNADADEASMKLYYYKNNHFFYCYTECGGQSIFTFLKHYYEIRNIEYDWYEDIIKVVQNCSVATVSLTSTPRYHSIIDNYKLRKERKELPEINRGILDVFVERYPQVWLEDGISKQAMDKYNILYSIPQNKIIIPHYDVNGRLVGIRGRALDEWEIENIGKYMPIQIEQKWYSHPLSLNLYGLDKNRANIESTGICFVVESEKSVMQAESFNMPNCCVAVCGSKLNKYHVDLLLRYCHPKEIVICFDNEEVGRETKYFNTLYEMCKKYKNYCNFSFVYDSKNITNKKDSPTDRGEKIFRKLLDERIKV